MKCCFCGTELEPARDSFGNILTRRWTCLNQTCIAFGDQATDFLWTKVIDGKKAQEDLACMKHNYSVISEQKEIAYQNYLKITGDLQKQLQKAQDALKGIGKILLVDTNKPTVLTVKGKQEIRRRIASITKMENE